LVEVVAAADVVREAPAAVAAAALVVVALAPAPAEGDEATVGAAPPMGAVDAPSICACTSGANVPLMPVMLVNERTSIS
jgi:hypothetical protein